MSLEISIEQPTKFFKKHLEEEGNERIIFSGAFGIGKTYFLEKFFSRENTNYISIKLAPINYSLSSNEDIFKLIKYDILAKLITEYNLTLEREPIRLDIAIGVMLPSKIDSLIKNFLGALPLLNIATDSIQKTLDSIKDLGSIVSDITKQQQEASQESDAINFRKDAIKMFQLETDYVTEFLEESLNNIAIEHKNASKVLIIDDLDRIDPEHIFRLFNIFSAHLDYHKNSAPHKAGNKFGFDKVIFVCDINNIRNIFHSRYGADTDFTGYIDKFFSQEVFFFSNEQAVHQAAKTFINSIRIPDDCQFFLKNGILDEQTSGRPSIVSIILTELLLSGAIKMRRLQSRFKMHYEPSDIELAVFYQGSTIATIWQLKGLVSIEVLSKISGGAEYLLRALKTASTYKRSSGYEIKERLYAPYILSHLIPVLDYRKHRFQTDGTKKGISTAAGGVILYLIAESRDQAPYYYAKLDDDITVDIFEFLIKTVELLIKEGILK